MAMMQTNGLYESLLGTKEQPNEPATGASKEERKNNKVLNVAYEQALADIKEKTINVWCYLTLPSGEKIHMLMRHDCVEDNVILDGERVLKLWQERFQIVGRRRWRLWLHNQFGAVMIWITFSLEDKSCSPGYKRQGKHSKGLNSAPWFSVI